MGGGAVGRWQAEHDPDEREGRATRRDHQEAGGSKSEQRNRQDAGQPQRRMDAAPSRDLKGFEKNFVDEKDAEGKSADPRDARGRREEKREEQHAEAGERFGHGQFENRGGRKDRAREGRRGKQDPRRRGVSGRSAANRNASRMYGRHRIANARKTNARRAGAKPVQNAARAGPSSTAAAGSNARPFSSL